MYAVAESLLPGSLSPAREDRNVTRLAFASAADQRIILVESWFEELKARVPK